MQKTEDQLLSFLCSISNDALRISAHPMTDLVNIEIGEALITEAWQLLQNVADHEVQAQLIGVVFQVLETLTNQGITLNEHLAGLYEELQTQLGKTK